MKLNTTSGFVSLICGGFVTLCATSAQAFTPFTFTNTFTQNIPGPKTDIKLTSVNFGGKIITDFSLVNDARIITNDVLTGSNKGPSSSDHGDNTVGDGHDLQGPAVELPTNADVVASLGNTNLNSIIDTEDDFGTSDFDVFFETPTDTFFLWERGVVKDIGNVPGNSDLLVQAITGGTPDAPVYGSVFKITRDKWTDAGYSINTKEMTSGVAQRVGSYGLKSTEGKLIGLKLYSEIGFNGPDYKVIGEKKVPEPATLAGLGLVAGSLVASRRRRQAGKVC